MSQVTESETELELELEFETETTVYDALPASEVSPVWIGGHEVSCGDAPSALQVLRTLAEPIQYLDLAIPKPAPL